MNPGAASGGSLFYIEDDVVVLTAYRDRLRKAGYQVEGSVDGIEAMRILSARTFDLIILDLLLPRFSGAEILQAIRANPRLKSIHVVIVSSNLRVVEDSVLKLADRFLLKGEFNFPNLLDSIQNLLTARKAGGDAKNN